MIGKLKGLIDSYGEDYVILDVGGVGYQVHCAGRTLQALPAETGVGYGLVGGYHDDPVFFSGRTRRDAPTVPTLRNTPPELKSPAQCGEYHRAPVLRLQLQNAPLRGLPRMGICHSPASRAPARLRRSRMGA